MTSKEQLKKESEDFIKLKFWNTYYYSSGLLRKKYEENIPLHLDKNKKYKILDYGCGVRPYEYIFEPFSLSYTGIDVGENDHADIIIDPDGMIPLNDEEFDIVLSSQVLEHVEDSENYLKECKRVLKKNGLLILSTHGTWQFHSHPVDIQRWTSMGLKKLIEKSGYKVTGFVPVLGQLALTSQLRLTFYDSFVKQIFKPLMILYYPLSALYQIKMKLEDMITPQRVKERDSAYYLLFAKKI